MSAPTVETRRQIRDKSHNPLDTDAWAFLNLKNPICAWAAYRGALVTPPRYGGFISIWSASVFKDQDSPRLDAELLLEKCRAEHFPFCVSRLKGMFCFRELSAAENALGLAEHFRVGNLVELSTRQAKRASGPYDGKWLNHAAQLQTDALLKGDWCFSYWEGTACDARPLWETLIEGVLIVLGTAVRERAYAKLRIAFPESLALLEIGRMAAWLGSDLGNVSAFLGQTDDGQTVCSYGMDMRDAANLKFLRALVKLRESGHPINWNDIRPQFERDLFGRTMDLRRSSFLIRNPRLSFSLPYGNLFHQVVGELLPSGQVQLASSDDTG